MPNSSDLWNLIERQLQGALTSEEQLKLESLLHESPDRQDAWFSAVDLHLALAKEFGAVDESLPRSTAIVPVFGRNRQAVAASVCAAAVLVCAMLLLGPWSSPDEGHLAGREPAPTSLSSHGIAPATVRLSQIAAAEFADEKTPEVGSALTFGKSFLLRKGQVELSFPAGATAIIKSPAVFTVESADRVRLDLGSCSVHAPEGAEGFEVVGPRTRVVDLGTRFSMEVNEIGVAEVQVLEGAARMTPVDRPNQGALLKAGAAGQHAATGELQSSRFDGQRYQHGLPDRVVKYEAARHPQGQGVRDLESVTVQRGGRAYRYAASELIGVEVTHFRSDANISNVVWDVQVPADPLEVLAGDVALNTGLVNFGRGPKAAGTGTAISDRAGLGIHFREPIVNDIGADLVLFEIHAAIYPPEGDFFRIGPMAPTDGQKSVLIKQYDLGWTSADTKVIAPFQLSRYKRLPASISDLKTGEYQSAQLTVSLPYRALVVGIDLSEMGLAPGDQISDFFIEDAGDDESVLDPVFIGGLPPMSRSQTRQPGN